MADDGPPPVRRDNMTPKTRPTGTAVLWHSWNQCHLYIDAGARELDPENPDHTKKLAAHARALIDKTIKSL